jgi:hypothetical protein
MWFVLFLWTEFIYAHCLYMCSLSLYMPCCQWCYFWFYSHYYWAYALYLTFVNSKPMPLCQWSFGCYTIWALVLSVFSVLFGLWWNCPTPEINWDMSWWSRTCEEFSIIINRPYYLYRYAHCCLYAHYFYDAFML